MPATASTTAAIVVCSMPVAVAVAVPTALAVMPVVTV
jgi:hypothetical protein